MFLKLKCSMLLLHSWQETAKPHSYTATLWNLNGVILKLSYSLIGFFVPSHWLHVCHWELRHFSSMRNVATLIKVLFKDKCFVIIYPGQKLPHNFSAIKNEFIVVMRAIRLLRIQPIATTACTSITNTLAKRIWLQLEFCKCFPDTRCIWSLVWMKNCTSGFDVIFSIIKSHTYTGQTDTSVAISTYVSVFPSRSFSKCHCHTVITTYDTCLCFFISN